MKFSQKKNFFILTVEKISPFKANTLNPGLFPVSTQQGALKFNPLENFLCKKRNLFI